MQKKKSEIDFTKSSHASATNIASKRSHLTGHLTRGGGQKEDCKSPEVGTTGRTSRGGPAPSQRGSGLDLVRGFAKGEHGRVEGIPTGAWEAPFCQKGTGTEHTQPRSFHRRHRMDHSANGSQPCTNQAAFATNRKPGVGAEGKCPPPKKMPKNIALLTQRGHSNTFAPVFLFGTLGCPAPVDCLQKNILLFMTPHCSLLDSYCSER